MTEPNEPTSPQLHVIDGNWQREPLSQFAGLTKREHFAGLAMQGLMGLQEEDGNLAISPDQAAKWAVTTADALIAELNKEQKP